MSFKKQRLEPRKPPVQRRSRTTVSDLLAAAAQVFEKHGYTSGTTNRIAECAGVSVGTLYQYYPSKDAIAVALLEKHIEDTSRRLHEWVGHMVAEEHGLSAALLDYVSGMLETHSGSPRLQHILLEETPLPDRVHKALLEAENQAAKTMGNLLRLYPEVKHSDSICAGFLVVQTVESLTHRFAAHPGNQILTKEQFISELVIMLKNYLAN